MKNIIFIDLDGTLILENQTIPKSAELALSLARNNGNKLVVATGRSKDAIPKALLNHEFDGYIFSSGAYAEVGNTVIREVFFEKEELEVILLYLESKGAAYYLETENGVIASHNAEAVILKNWRASEETDNKALDALMTLVKNTIDETTQMHTVMKICYISDHLSTDQIKLDFKDTYDTIPNTIYEFGDYSGEILLKNNDKSDAVNDVITYFGNDHKSYAYGDGLNDITMFQVVDHAVAMGGCNPKLIEYADELTDPPQRDGILNSFRRNNIIQ